MEAYLQAFINFKQNDWVQFLFIIEFAYNNAKNASTNHILFKLNCGYYFYVFYKEDLDLYLKLRIAEEFFFEL